MLGLRVAGWGWGAPLSVPVGLASLTDCTVLGNVTERDRVLETLNSSNVRERDGRLWIRICAVEVR